MPVPDLVVEERKGSIHVCSAAGHAFEKLPLLLVEEESPQAEPSKILRTTPEHQCRRRTLSDFALPRTIPTEEKSQDYP